MFNWLTKKLTRKITLVLLIMLAALSVGVYFYTELPHEFPAEYVLFALGGLIIIFLLILHQYISRPLSVLTKQMKYLLTGKLYKKIYTNRIDEIGIIAQFFNEVTENLESISKRLKDAQRMASELEIASSIQQTILPHESPNIPGLEVVAKTRPAVEIGGDNFDFINRKNNTFIYLGDVTGHGAPSALVMMMANTLLNTYSEMYDNLYDIVVNTNRQLKPRIKSAMFMTMVILKWDQNTEKLTYLGAGHEYILVYRVATGVIESIKTGGIALGMVPDNSKLVKEQPIDLEKGDMVILYTDGITEAKNDAGEMFGIDRFKETLIKYAAVYGPEGVAHHTSLDFSQFVGEAEQLDDISLIVMKYTGKEIDAGSAANAQTKTTQWLENINEN
ncbi:SpoIIE family protein phosphatase [Candidatus Peregrinibacteria bacterium]|nr:SpoIIE family protein phosphatase [Candidatus Peregrinibacteria bacterium]